jgi:hypothetical protein
MSLLVTAAIVGGGALVAAIGTRIAVAARRRARARAHAANADAAAAGAKPAESRLAETGFTVQQGDVISVTGRELWLEQGWLLLEGNDAIAAILFAREAVVLAHPKPRPRFYYLNEIELRLPADPPSALDHGGVRYERARRLPIAIEPLPKSPDPPWQTALLTEYRGLGSEVLWALIHSGTCRAWSGRAVDDAEIELWGGGSSTLEP